MSHRLKKENDDAGIVIIFSGRAEADDVDSISRKTSHSVLGKTFHTFEKVWRFYESKSFRNIHDAREWGQSGKT